MKKILIVLEVVIVIFPNARLCLNPEILKSWNSDGRYDAGFRGPWVAGGCFASPSNLVPTAILNVLSTLQRQAPAPLQGHGISMQSFQTLGLSLSTIIIIIIIIMYQNFRRTCRASPALLPSRRTITRAYCQPVLPSSWIEETPVLPYSHDPSPWRAWIGCWAINHG